MTHESRSKIADPFLWVASQCHSRLLAPNRVGVSGDNWLLLCTVLMSRHVWFAVLLNCPTLLQTRKLLAEAVGILGLWNNSLQSDESSGVPSLQEMTPVLFQAGALKGLN